MTIRSLKELHEKTRADIEQIECNVADMLAEMIG